MGTGGEAGNQTFKGLEDKMSWVEKFLRVGAVGMEAAQDEHSRHPFTTFSCAPPILKAIPPVRYRCLQPHFQD